MRHQRTGPRQTNIRLPLRRPALEFLLSLVDLLGETTGLFHDDSPNLRLHFRHA